jgi:ribosome-binding protein aMBF1 (putative translation factor)
MKCEVCGKTISYAIDKYSVRNLGKSLCLDCQRTERFKTNPPELAKLLNTRLDKYLKK